MTNAQRIIETLGLSPHPNEGGYFVETYRSSTSLPADALGGAFSGARDVSTAIYYMLTPETFSAMHRLPGDEVFHFYLGDPVQMLQLHPDGRVSEHVLGTDLEAGARPQLVVDGGVWQGSRLVDGGGFALLGTTMAPGFDFADYEHGDRGALTAEFPSAADRIRALTT